MVSLSAFRFRSTFIVTGCFSNHFISSSSSSIIRLQSFNSLLENLSSNASITFFLSFAVAFLRDPSFQDDVIMNVAAIMICNDSFIRFGLSNAFSILRRYSCDTDDSNFVHNCVTSRDISVAFGLVAVRRGVEIKSCGMLVRNVPNNRLNIFSGMVIGACFNNFGGGAAHGGQVLCAAATASDVAAGLPAGIGVRSLGAHELTNIDGREEIHQVLADGLRRDFPPVRVRKLARRTCKLPRRTGQSFVAPCRGGRGGPRAPPRQEVRDAHGLRRCRQDAAVDRGRPRLRRHGRRRRVVRRARRRRSTSLCRPRRARVRSRSQSNRGAEIYAVMLETLRDQQRLLRRGQLRARRRGVRRCPRGDRHCLPAHHHPRDEPRAAPPRRRAALPGASRSTLRRATRRRSRTSAGRRRWRSSTSGPRPGSPLRDVRRGERPGRGVDLPPARRDPPRPRARRRAHRHDERRRARRGARAPLRRAHEGEPNRPRAPPDPPRAHRLVLRPADRGRARGAPPAQRLPGRLRPRGRRRGVDVRPSRRQPRELVDSLVDKSLVIASVGARRTQYSILESLRQFGAERLAPRSRRRGVVGDQAEAGRRSPRAALRGALRARRGAPTTGRTRPSRSARAREDQENLRLAVAELVDGPGASAQPACSRCACSARRPPARRRCPRAQALLGLLDRALALATPAAVGPRAAALYCKGRFLMYSEQDGLREALVDAVEAARVADAPNVEVAGLGYLTSRRGPEPRRAGGRDGPRSAATSTPSPSPSTSTARPSCTRTAPAAARSCATRSPSRSRAATPSSRPCAGSPWLRGGPGRAPRRCRGALRTAGHDLREGEPADEPVLGLRDQPRMAPRGPGGLARRAGLLLQSLRLARLSGARHLFSYALLGLGCCALDAARSSTPPRCTAAQRGRRAGRSMAWEPMEDATCARNLAVLEPALGERFEILYAEGRRPTDELVARVLER